MINSSVSGRMSQIIIFTMTSISHTFRVRGHKKGIEACANPVTRRCVHQSSLSLVSLSQHKNHSRCSSGADVALYHTLTESNAIRRQVDDKTNYMDIFLHLLCHLSGFLIRQTFSSVIKPEKIFPLLRLSAFKFSYCVWACSVSYLREVRQNFP